MLLPRDETTGRLEFVDEHGTPVGKVHLPNDTQLFGLEKGTVYLQRPVPVATSPSRTPAQSA